MEIAFSSFSRRTIRQEEITGVIGGELQEPYPPTMLDSKQTTKGLSLTRDDLTASYAIIRHNIRTYRSAGVVEVVRGKQNAESTVKKFEASQASTDRQEGWRYFFEKSDLKAGTDPEQATHLRQTDLETREWNAQQETNPLPRSSSDTRR